MTYPQINGIEVTRCIRATGNKVPIIAFSHHKDKDLIAKWIPLGLSSYLIKPSKKSIIIETVSKAVENPVEVLNPESNRTGDDIVWIPSYSVGHEVMDEQHKMLFSLINDFFKTKGKQSVIVLFENLSSYVQLHFEAEEELLRGLTYPKIAQHMKKHRELAEKFKAMQNTLDHYEEDTHYKIAMFLYKWLANHIVKADMDYKRYALKQQAKGFSKTTSVV